MIEVKKIIHYSGVVCFLFFCTEIKGQTAAIKEARTTANTATAAFKPYQRFIDNDSVHWIKGGDASLQFAATSLTNWVAGGEDQIGVRSAVNLFANYKKGKRTFENYAILAYGILKTGDRKGVKNDDRLHFTSKLGHQISPKLAYTSAFLARTQFAPGYKYSGDKITAKVSDFLAPLSMYLSIGIDYMPSKNVSLMLSPIMGRGTFVRSDSSTVVIAAGMMTEKTDEFGNKKQIPLRSRYEYGGGALLKFNGNLFQNKVNYSSQIELFSNYAEKPQNMEIFWLFDTKIMLYKNITASWQIQLKYDDKQKTKDETTGELRGAKVQTKYFTGIGLLYQF